ncbi:MAG: hypothetical protein DELT_02090 [Desulfovibrio sp.]
MTKTMPYSDTDTRVKAPLAPDFSGRDRVLLYTRGMNLSPVRGVALALRSLRRAGEDAPAAIIMSELFATLRENRLRLTWKTATVNGSYARRP